MSFNNSALAGAGMINNAEHRYLLTIQNTNI